MSSLKICLSNLNVTLVPLAVVLDLAHGLDRRLGIAALIALEMDLAVAAHLDLAPLRQGIDGADADAMQTARDLVAAAAKLAAGVQGGHHHFEGGFLLGGVLADRNAAAVVVDGDAAIRMDRDLDAVAGARQGLINGVVHHLVDQVVQGLDIRTADIHARTAANGLEALQDLDVFCFVTTVGILLSHGRSILQEPLGSAPFSRASCEGRPRGSPRARIYACCAGMPARRRASTVCSQLDIS